MRGGSGNDEVGIVVGAVTSSTRRRCCPRPRASEVEMYLEVVGDLDPTVDGPRRSRSSASPARRRDAAHAREPLRRGVKRVESVTPQGSRRFARVELCRACRASVRPDSVSDALGRSSVASLHEGGDRSAGWGRSRVRILRDFGIGERAGVDPGMTDRFQLRLRPPLRLLLLAATASSSLVQPLFGLWSDRRGRSG